MIRGKKNYMPACQLQMGFGLMFKLDDDSVERHIEERKVGVAALTEEDISVPMSVDAQDDDVSLDGSDGNDEERKSDDEAENFPDVQVRKKCFSSEFLSDLESLMLFDFSCARCSYTSCSRLRFFSHGPQS